MKQIHCPVEFRNRTKPIYDDFELDIKPDYGLAFFFPHRLDELKQYCLDHPQYHIMSMLQAVTKVNKPVSGARFYQLATGDADPDLWYRSPSGQIVLELSKIIKFDRD